ncbi:MAG TPA: hypothetical protein VFP50_18890 [Anaeromyxobacteraceae bacterium]|nr:hypothetical protein [Anaeromyxobacteraceae bacterium]
MKRLGILTTCALLAACGGSGTRSNAAAGKTFSYSAPVTATAAETAALDAQVASAATLNGSLDASTAPNAVGMADFSGATDALLPQGATLRVALPKSVSAPLPRLALSVAATSGFDLPQCVSVNATGTSGTITFSNCAVTSTTTDTYTNVTTTTKVTLSGTVHSAAPGSLDWDLTAGVSMTDSQGVALSGSAHQHGDLTVTSTTIKGSMLAETALTMTAPGGSISAAVDESLTVDVTYTAGPPECVTGGTLEAKRVWVQRPQGATAAQLPDQAAKITWTGCGTGEIAFSQ